MTLPVHRSVVGRRQAALAVAVAITALAGACAPAGSPQVVLRTPEPVPTDVSPTATPTEPASPTPTAPPIGDLAWYVSQLPAFDPAPAPQPVWLSRYEGQAAFTYQIPTDQPVAFLTIDDGAVRHPMALDLLRAAKVPVTFFLTTNYVAHDPGWFAALRDTGYATIHNHTVSHPNLRTGGYAVARDQLCRANDLLGGWFGQRPTLFRPPYGEYDAATLQAAWDCGLTAGLHWRETVDQGTVYYQRDWGRIHAGDIILMHFRPAFPDDFLAALLAIKNSGLVPARLEDYIRVGDTIPVTTTPPEPEPEPTPDDPTQPPVGDPDPDEPDPDPDEPGPDGADPDLDGSPAS